MVENPVRLADLKKDYFKIQPERYLDTAIQNAQSATRLGFEGKTFNESMDFKIVCIEEAESIALAMGVIKRGKYFKDEENKIEEKHSYQKGIDLYLDKYPAPDESNKDVTRMWKVKFANWRLQLIISAIHKHNPTTVEFNL